MRMHMQEITRMHMQEITWMHMQEITPMHLLLSDRRYPLNEIDENYSICIIDRKPATSIKGEFSYAL